jgi:hypothetical protein
MKIEITRVQNGFTVLIPKEEPDGFDKVLVFQEDDDEENGELKNMRSLLWFLKEEFGVYWSKHNRFNLDIEVKEFQ